MLEQPRVPHPVKVIVVAVEDNVPPVTALVAVVFIVQRLVQVADEMNHELEGLGARGSGFGARVRGIGWSGDRVNEPLARHLSLATRHSSQI